MIVHPNHPSSPASATSCSAAAGRWWCSYPSHALSVLFSRHAQSLGDCQSHVQQHGRPWVPHDCPPPLPGQPLHSHLSDRGSEAHEPWPRATGEGLEMVRLSPRLVRREEGTAASRDRLGTRGPLRRPYNIRARRRKRRKIKCNGCGGRVEECECMDVRRRGDRALVSAITSGGSAWRRKSGR